MRLFRLEDLTWRELGRRLVTKLREDTVTDGAAQLSFYFLLSLFPFLFFLVTLAAYLPFAEGAVESMVARLAPLVPGEAMVLVDEHLRSLVEQPRPRLLTLGLVVALWLASRGVNALRKALNRAHEVAESRPLWKTQAVAMLMTLLGTLLIPLSFTAFLLGGRVGEWIAERLRLVEAFHLLWMWLRWPFTAALVMLILAACYHALPNVKRRFKYITPGSVLGTALWLLSTWGFTQYVEHFGRYNVTYGSIGGVMVLLLWLYITGLIFILGGELDALLEHSSRGAKARSASRAHKPARVFWRRRVARGQSPEPSVSEPPDSSLH